jgi:hypothetical protein
MRKCEVIFVRALSCFCAGGTEKMNIEHRMLNVEWEKMKKQTYDLEKSLLEYSV